MVFSTFFNFSLNLAIRSSWSEPQSAPSLGFCWLYRASPSLAAKNIINLISVSTIWWCPCIESSLVVFGRGCLLWSVCCLGKTLWAFSLLHSVLQGQIFLLLQVFLDFLLSPIRHLFCSATFCHFFRQLHNSVFPKHFIFLSKELFHVCFRVFKGIEIFTIERTL